ncbi:RND transporter [Arenicella chitinivorans]|uniref:RND transporter n=1 Tax=Arenicella chitinivorans TaxID=1329800 RepID=A0A918RET0_9GAMM|nr:MMPL family transporter [Arenicella chitinivorans]GGZ96003.1 RND transporter [Arenicella chitinivorans]
MENTLALWLVKHRNYLALASVLLTLALALGAKNLYLNTNYNVFFDADDAQMVAHEQQQSEFTKTDNLVLLLTPKDAPTIFTEAGLHAVFDITERAWSTPFAIRVDSLTNFQHSYAENDDLVVADLLLEPEPLSQSDLERLQNIATNEPRLRNRIIAADGKSTLINVSVELPAYPHASASHSERVNMLLARDTAIRDVVAYGEALQQALSADYPELSVHLLGETVINQRLADASDRDAASLIPVMFLVIVIILGILLRSAVSIVAALGVILFAIVASIGLNGWLGAAMNMVNMVAPIIILTIAVCDSVHVLANYLDQLSQGDEPEQAMHHSLRINLQPVFITSLTTAVGFLTLNFSPSPPFRDLGSLCAFGVMYAMLMTITLLPAIAVKFIRSAKPVTRKDRTLTRASNWIIQHQTLALGIATVTTVVCLAFIPQNEIDDDPARYFKTHNPYRMAVDFSQTSLPGINDINFTLDCGTPDCIYQPEFLHGADKFASWLRTQDNVETVISYVEVIKKINANFHDDQSDQFKLPEDSAQIAQYNLLYELSLPYGLDLNTLTNMDKSAIKVAAFVRQTSTGNFLELESAAADWLTQDLQLSAPRGSSIRMMFSSLGEENIRGMIWGALFALLGVTLTILASLRSLRYGLISLVANSFPALIAIGIWGMTIAHVNMAVAAVFSITLGIIVDDSVHFISKYRYARLHKNYTPEDAIDYTMRNVGGALFVTTLVLTIGFGLLCFSDFNLNAYLGGLTALTVVVALVFDYLVLPPLLIKFDKQGT